MGNGLRKAISEENWNFVRCQLQENSVQNRVRTKQYKAFHNDHDETPAEDTVNALHLVLQKRVPIDIVQTIAMEIDPDAPDFVSYPSQELPIHFAVRNHSRSTERRIILELLLVLKADSVEALTSSGKTPLHVACESRASVEIIELLHSRFPTASDMQDNSQQTPWKLLMTNTKFWNFFYRRRLRRILHDDDGGGGGDDDVRPLWRRRREEADGNFLNGRRIRRGGIYPRRRTAAVAVDENETGQLHSARDQSDSDRKGSDSSESDEENGLCVLCWTGQANHVLIPCGHMCLCLQCCQNTKNLRCLRGKCPVCSKHYERAPMKVYQAGVVDPE